MKFFYVILLAFAFLGCSVSPFDNSKESFKPTREWNHNRLNTTFKEDYEQVRWKTQEVVYEKGIESDEEYSDPEIAWIDAKGMKITIQKKADKEAEVEIKLGILGDRALAEDLMKDIELKVNTVEYDDEGNPRMSMF